MAMVNSRKYFVIFCFGVVIDLWSLRFFIGNSARDASATFSLNSLAGCFFFLFHQEVSTGTKLFYECALTRVLNDYSYSWNPLFVN